MKSKLDRIVSVATLAALVAIFAVLRKPAAVVQSQPPAPAASARSIEQKMNQAEPAQPSQGSSGYYQQYQPSQASSAPQPVTSASPKTEGHSSSDGIGAAISQMLGATAGGGAAALNPDSNVGEGAPNIKDQKVTYEGDMVHGQFLTEIGGKDVWVTISGHMGEKDGYATFDPTEFKVGDTNVPVSLVNPMLQRKLAEERDRLKVSSPGGG